MASPDSAAAVRAPRGRLLAFADAVYDQAAKPTPEPIHGFSTPQAGMALDKEGGFFNVEFGRRSAS